jgi:hypothetical protein
VVRLEGEGGLLGFVQVGVRGGRGRSVRPSVDFSAMLAAVRQFDAELRRLGGTNINSLPAVPDVGSK